MIYYYYEKGKLYFGKVTFISWLLTYFTNRCIQIKPIKNYEHYCYYPKGWQVSTDMAMYGVFIKVPKHMDIVSYIKYIEKVR